jgi:drug/metabolite transporter (DMT)-like permease
MRFLNGILCALFSIFIGVIFTLLNGKFVQQHPPSVISLYEFFAGFVFISIYLFFDNQFQPKSFNISNSDWVYILILASVCSAYAFTASINVMKKLSPYTVLLTTNLEPVYGIILAYFILGESEKMSLTFYIGSLVILATVILNGWLQKSYKPKS